MDNAERIAADFLRSCGFKAIVHEPDGNVPPDFLADDSIAIEVRRLKKSDGASERSLDEVSKPLIDGIRSVLRSFGAPPDGRSWFVGYELKRPVERWKLARPKIASWLEVVRQNAPTTRVRAEVAKGLEMNVYPASHPLEQLFELGGYIDQDAAGYLLHDVRRHLEIYSAEKLRKVGPYRHKYPKWWLIFVDYIGYGLSAFEREIFASKPTFIGQWDRVVAVSPLDPSRWYEL